MTTKDNKYNRILFINPFGIGDVLFTTPVVRAVRENFPQAFIGYICNRRTKDMIENNPNINVLYIYEKDEYRAECAKSKFRCFMKFVTFLKSVKKDKYDLVIDLSLGRPYNFFSWFIGIKRRIGFNYKNRGSFLTDKIDIEGYTSKHIVEYNLDLLKFLKLDYAGVRLELFLSENELKWAESFFRDNSLTDQDLVIGMTPGGGVSWGQNSSFLHWRPEGFAQVADKLIREKGAKVIIMGDNRDVKICEQVYNLMENKPIVAYGKTSLKQFCALVKRCNLLICNDTGPLHIAVAVDTKTVCVAGPVDERVYGPYPLDPNQNRVVVAKLSCRPCYKKFRINDCSNARCLSQIGSEMVYKTAEELI